MRFLLVTIICLTFLNLGFSEEIVIKSELQDVLEGKGEDTKMQVVEFKVKRDEEITSECSVKLTNMKRILEEEIPLQFENGNITSKSNFRYLYGRFGRAIQIQNSCTEVALGLYEVTVVLERIVKNIPPPVKVPLANDVFGFLRSHLAIMVNEFPEKVKLDDAAMAQIANIGKLCGDSALEIMAILMGIVDMYTDLGIIPNAEIKKQITYDFAGNIADIQNCGDFVNATKEFFHSLQEVETHYIGEKFSTNVFFKVDAMIDSLIPKNTPVILKIRPSKILKISPRAYKKIIK